MCPALRSPSTTAQASRQATRATPRACARGRPCPRQDRRPRRSCPPPPQHASSPRRGESKATGERKAGAEPKLGSPRLEMNAALRTGLAGCSAPGTGRAHPSAAPLPERMRIALPAIPTTPIDMIDVYRDSPAPGTCPSMAKRPPSSSGVASVTSHPFGGCHARFRAEPRGEHREDGEAVAERATGEQVVRLAADAARGGQADEELQGDVENDAEGDRVHGPARRRWTTGIRPRRGVSRAAIGMPRLYRNRLFCLSPRALLTRLQIGNRAG